MNTEDRILALETRQSTYEARLAVAETNIDNINRKLDKIDANLSRLMWIVLAAIIGAVLKSVLTGSAL